MIVGYSRKFGGGGASLHTVHLQYTPTAGQSQCGVCASWDGSSAARTMQSAQNWNSGDPVSLSNSPIGTASSDRIVIVTLQGILNGGGAASASMTIAGASATKIKEANGLVDGGGNRAYSSIFALLVTSGTTANIVATFGQAFFDMEVVVYSTTGVGSARDSNLFSASDSGAQTKDLSVNVASGGGLVIAAACLYNLSPVSETWTGVTSDNAVNIFGSDQHLSASYVGTP